MPQKIELCVPATPPEALFNPPLLVHRGALAALTARWALLMERP